MNHQVGPWTWERDGCELVNAAHGQVLRIDCPEFVTDDDKNLIAAAPELLTALKDMVHVFTDIKGETDYEREALRIGREAIAKATRGAA